MNGVGYDESLRSVESYRALAETNNVEYCKKALHVFDKAAISQPKYNKILQNLKQRVSENNFDKQTIDLATVIIDQAKSVYSTGLTYSINSYHAQIQVLLKEIRRTAKLFLITNNFLQMIIIVGATSVPFLLNIPIIEKPIPTVVSAMVAVAAALNNQFKFKQHGIIHQQIAQKIKREFNLHATGRGVYSTLPLGAALDLFMDRIDEIRHEQHEQLISLHKTSQDGSKDHMHEVKKLGDNKA